MSMQRADVCGNMLDWKGYSEGVGGFEKRVWHASGMFTPDLLQLGSEGRVWKDDAADEGFEGGGVGTW